MKALSRFSLPMAAMYNVGVYAFPPFSKRGVRGDFILSHTHTNRNIFIITSIWVGDNL